MPDHLFDVSLRQYPVSLERVTDTVAPIPSVPLYFIHSFEQPFCADACCTCHAQQQEVLQLFVKIIEGYVELEPATALLANEEKEARA